MSKLLSLEVLKILNDVGITWKVRRALLIHKVGLSEEQAKELVPEPKHKYESRGL